MPFVVKGQPVPEEPLREGKRAKKAYSALNVAVPLLYLVDEIFLVTIARRFVALLRPALICASCFFIANGILQIVSAIYLGTAVNSIRKFINAGNGFETVNTKYLIQHFLAFGLYLLSTLSVYTFFAAYYISDISFVYLLVSQIVSNVLSLFAQLCLCSILWQLSSTGSPPMQATLTQPAIQLQESGEPTIELQDFDEQSDLQARLWN
jgi:hypothetical protein